ncbi:MAG: hypothetical protein GKC10_02305 [Methanosarcinales archaeon]|nr:hypothetical protein [Methanosarcinales archaeon]
MTESFESMNPQEKLSYVIENRRSLPEELVEMGIDVLVENGETEYAVVLARDSGRIDRAVQILVDAGDYLWAALIARNADRPEQAERLYQEGLGYYIKMEMFGRAVSAATALNFPPHEIDALFRKGIEVESRGMNMDHARAMIDTAMESLEISLIGRDDELSRELMSAVRKEREDHNPL